MYNKSVTSKEKGNRGEDLAVSDYVNRGYRILERNYRCPYGEIDAVLEKNSLIVFFGSEGCGFFRNGKSFRFD